MLRSKFKKLQKYLDNLILDNINSNSILAYAKLHLIKNHPEFNKEYFPNKIELRKNKNIKNFYFGLINFFKNFITEDTNFYIKNNKTFKPKVLILSHLINLKHLNSKDDFYYGDLVNQLNNLNLDSKLILRNETKLSSKQIFEKLNKDKIILSKRTFFLSEILYLFIALTNFIKFNLKIKKYRYKKKSINFFTLKSFGYIISNLRLNSQINYLLKIYEPKFLIITFEGHGWERLIIRNVKKNKKTKVIAYQFSAITKDHHSLFRSLSKTTDPDFIFTTGTHTYKKFKKSYNCKVKIIGSHKWKKIASYNKKKTKNNVLILPEAYVSESKDLLNFAIQISKFNKEFYFYLRLHPMINIKELNVDIKKYKNIELSNYKIEDDFKRSSNFIYRGSASAIEAAANGLNPIYFGKVNDANVNPLFEVLNKNDYITDPKKFVKAIKKNTFKKNFKVRKYSQNFFKKLSINKNTLIF